MIRVAPIAVAVTLALLAAACTPQSSQTAADVRTSVAVAPVKPGRIERSIVTTGTVRALSSAKAVTEAAGRLTVAENPRARRRWAIGDEVRQGELLATIARAELATQARLDAKRQALAAAKADHERYHALHEQGLVSALQMAEQDTRLSNAEAEARAAELQESKSRLTAPITGVVTSVTTSPDGELVADGQTLAEIMEFSNLIVDLDLGSGEILDVQAGQPVRVSVPGTSLVVEGAVARTAPAIDPRTRTFRVEVALPNGDRRMRPGMFVRAEIVLEAHEGVLIVPAAAIVMRDGSPSVFVIEAQQALQRAVTIGLATEESAEITEGVTEGQQVVVSGQETLDDLQRVVVRE